MASIAGRMSPVPMGEGEEGQVLVLELGQQPAVHSGEELPVRAVPEVDVAEVEVRAAGVFRGGKRVYKGLVAYRNAVKL